MMPLSIAQYIVFTKTLKYTMWLKRMIGKLAKDYVTIHYDSQSIIHLVDYQIYHKITKHINITIHFETLLNLGWSKSRK